MGSQMKLTYWVAKCTNDCHQSHNLRGKTKKAVLDLIALHKDAKSWHEFEAPRKVNVYYVSGLDLVDQCLGHAGGYWE